MAKLTEQERQQRKLERQAERGWRRELCVELSNEAIKANAEAEPERRGEYLSPAFLELIAKFIR